MTQRVFPSTSNLADDAAETLVERAYRRLRSDIIRGERAPGERLRIDRLKSIYEIGPSPLREALQRLSADRLVLAQGNRGFAVAPLDFDDFADLNIARSAVELAALQRSIANGDSAWEAGVVAARYLMAKEDAALVSAVERVPDSWEQANAAFHLSLVAACGSAWLLRTRAGLHDFCERFRRASVYHHIGKRDLAREHDEIASATLARDARLACELLERHFAATAAQFADPSTRPALEPVE